MKIRVEVYDKDTSFEMTMISVTPVSYPDGEDYTLAVCYDEEGYLHTFTSDKIKVIIPH